MVVFRSINGVMTLPKVSSPRVSGVTSKRTTSLTSPVRIPPWMAAPTATTSSGLTDLLGSRPKNFLTSSITLGMRVMPPTKTTSSILEVSILASLRQALTGAMVLAIKSSISDSSLARDSLRVKCRGWPLF